MFSFPNFLHENAEQFQVKLIILWKPAVNFSSLQLFICSQLFLGKAVNVNEVIALNFSVFDRIKKLL